jgi:hypothetical protein
MIRTMKVLLAVGLVAGSALAAASPSLAQARRGHTDHRTAIHPQTYNSYGYDQDHWSGSVSTNGGSYSYGYAPSYSYGYAPYSSYGYVPNSSRTPTHYTYWPPTGSGSSYFPGIGFGG